MNGLEVVVVSDPEFRMSSSQNEQEHCDEQIAHDHASFDFMRGLMDEFFGRQGCVHDEPDDSCNTAA